MRGLNIALFFIFQSKSNAFQPVAFAPSSFLKQAVKHGNKYNGCSSSLKMTSDECLLTPEGFGFSTPASRILSLSSTGEDGYVSVKNSDRVVDVMDQISDGKNPDVALVFDDDESNKLVGIFTEKDYVDVSVH